MVIQIIVVLTLVWLAWIDSRTRTIPDEGIILLLLCGLLRICLGDLRILDAVLGLLALGIPVLLLAILWGRGTAIGGGDIKLCASIGFLLGPAAGFIAIYTSILLLALCGLIFRRKALPFAPFCLPVYCIILILRSVSHV